MDEGCVRELNVSFLGWAEMTVQFWRQPVPRWNDVTCPLRVPLQCLDCVM